MNCVLICVHQFNKVVNPLSVSIFG